MARTKPLLDEVKFFVRWHLGRGCFAPHTGQDWPAWSAFVHLVQCWTHGGGEDAIKAMQMTLLCAQPTNAVLRTFVQAIPAVGDWCHVRELWPRIAEPIATAWPAIGRSEGDPRALCALEKHVDYDAQHKPIAGSERYTRHGWKSTGNLQAVP